MQNFAELLGFVAEECLKPLTTEVYSLNEFTRAFSAIGERKAQVKVVLIMGH